MDARGTPRSLFFFFFPLSLSFFPLPPLSCFSPLYFLPLSLLFFFSLSLSPFHHRNGFTPSPLFSVALWGYPSTTKGPTTMEYKAKRVKRNANRRNVGTRARWSSEPPRRRSGRRARSFCEPSWAFSGKKDGGYHKNGVAPRKRYACRCNW